MEKRLHWWRACCILALMVLVVLPVLAYNEKIILALDESAIRNGKNITLIGVEANAANIKVDGVLGSIKKGDLKFLGGVEINLTGLSTQPVYAILNVTINFICGNQVCDNTLGEDTISCCADCGCLGKEVCISNSCVENITTVGTFGYECYADSDCGAATACSSAICDKTVVPHKCKVTTISTCAAGDGCCPSTCDFTTDTDCAAVNLCAGAAECADEDPCTIDSCTGTPTRCTHEAQQGCRQGNECIKLGERKDVYYCSSTSQLSFLKSGGSVCVEDYECFSSTCSDGVCAGKKGWGVLLYSMLIAGIIFAGVVAFYMYAKVQQKDGGDQ